MLCLTRGSITSVPLSMLFHAWDSCPMCSCLKSHLRLLGRMLLLPVPQACGAKGPTLPANSLGRAMFAGCNQDDARSEAVHPQGA